MNFKWIFFLLFSFNASSIFAQENLMGIPFITNYPKSVYNAGTQNWAIAQNKNAELFFANNSGLLTFDGVTWSSYSMPNNSVVRSLLVDSVQRIFVGAFDEFGYFDKDSLGFYKYTSISKSLKQSSSFGEIWKIHQLGDSIVFQSFTSIFVYYKEKIRVFKEKKDFEYSFIVDSSLYVVEKNKGLFKLEKGQFIQIFSTDFLLRLGEILSIKKLSASKFLVIATKGVFYFDGKNIKNIKLDNFPELLSAKIYCGTFVDSLKFVIGTVQKGLYIYNSTGKLIQHLEKENGLLNNTVLSVFVDNNKNLWLGLDNGISYVEINSPFTNFGEAKGVLGTGYTSIIFNQKLYLGTNQGLFVYPINSDLNQRASFIQGSEGQVWTLFEYQNTLFCGHHDGIFIVKGNQLTKISSELGNWIFLPLENNPDKLLVGTYSGLSILERDKNENWRYLSKVKGFSESCRIMTFDNEQHLWMSHGYKGVFKIKLNSTSDSVQNVEFYNSKNGFPSDYAISVFKWQNKVLFSTENGIYTFDSLSNGFIKSKIYNNLFKNAIAYNPKQDRKGNIWFNHDSKLSYLEMLPNQNRVHDNEFSKLQGKLVAGFEYFSSLDSEKIIIGNEDGFIFYNMSKEIPLKSNFVTLIKQVKLSSVSDSILLGQADFIQNIPTIAFRNNSVFFSYAAPFYDNSDKTKYSTFLKAYDLNWSNWQNRNQKEYTNLESGKYTFLVKAMNAYGRQSKISSFSFIIKKPWYKTYYAYAFYLFISILSAFIVAKLLTKKIEREKRLLAKKQEDELKKQKQEHDKKTLQAEKEIIKLRNDMLRAEIEKKNFDFDIKKKELATVALKNTHKNEILLKVKDQLLQLSGKIDEKSFVQIKKLIKSIDNEIRLDQDWELFKRHFEEVHGDFFKRLKTQYPDLTPKDLKLCAYLRINLATKEIAPLLNISVRGVEIGRYRLRKKLGINSDENLFEFMLQI